ncbi:carcinoembryonic antigen-related cell adhesion molecule 8-like [Sorex araneus]|uniref:carcinoembryonic antigen-related cell adhesion molecule 8-like n=1 Tax=Sorex araneus TaxID=42254 RepID=UPI0024335D20|nr:carcinoembryonic antigen-related cell adhesion molecule 8-like [Sorex araneus]
MEPPSAPTHRGRVPWKGLLLTATLLPFWSLPANAASVEIIPSNAVVGDDVTMFVHKVPENTVRLDWYKGVIESKNIIITLKINPENITNGPLFSHRETLFNNGTLHIQNLTQRDKSTYLIQIFTMGGDSITARGVLGVYVRLTKPQINADNEHPTEKKDTVTLQCDPETPDTTYRWFFNSKPVAQGGGLELSKQNRVLTLSPALRNNTGAYVCENWNPVSSKTSDQFNLAVLYGPDPPIISPSKNFYRRGASLSLSCYTASHPPAKFTWSTSKQATVVAQNFFIPALSLDDSGSYTCFVSNNVTLLKATNTINITVLDPVTSASIHASNTTVAEGDNNVILVCITNDTDISTQWVHNNQPLQPSDTKLLSRDNKTLTITSISVSDAGDYHCEISNPISSIKSPRLELQVTSRGPGKDFRLGNQLFGGCCVVDDANPCSRSKHPGGFGTGGISTDILVGIVIGCFIIGVLIGTAFAAVLGYFLFLRKSERSPRQLDPREHQPPADSPGSDLVLNP